MSTNSRIEWTDASWNPVSGCTPVSAGCVNCYAATFSARGMTPKYAGLTKHIGGRAVFNGVIRLDEKALQLPLHWKKPRRIFVNSMSDLFHEDVPFEFVDKVFGIAALCSQHVFQVLTKRPERMAQYFARGYEPIVQAIQANHWNKLPQANPQSVWPIPNVWLGTSCEDQKTADLRISHLLRTTAAVRFLSLEPLLEQLDLTLPLGIEWSDVADCYLREQIHTLGGHPQPDWAIIGCESGPHRRPCSEQWVRSIVEQCQEASVPVFVKQLQIDGRVSHDMDEWPADLRVREFPKVTQ